MNRAKSDLKVLEGKLRQPIHISYLANYVLKKSIEETQKIIDKGVEQGIFEEYKFDGYYKLKNQD
jgi:hypothetical protein